LFSKRSNHYPPIGEIALQSIKLTTDSIIVQEKHVPNLSRSWKGYINKEKI